MSQNLSRELRYSKAAVRSKHGVVAAQNQKAADIGAEVLRAGGNAIDAAVAVSFSLGVLEPWMSGIGGGGFMVVYDAAKKTSHVIDYGMISASGLNPADYPLTGGVAGDLFGWPAVLEDRNIVGYHSIAIPGVVDGMRLALETFGTRSWAESLAPAVALAERGMGGDFALAAQTDGSTSAVLRFNVDDADPDR